MTWAYPLEQVRSEVAFIAYHFHWGLQEILDIPHPERVNWVGQITKINRAVLEAVQ